MSAYQIHTQESIYGGSWRFWIVAPNNLEIARSCRQYATQRAAERAATGLMKATTWEVRRR